MNEGHDVTSATEFVEACLSNGGIKNVNVSECQLTPSSKKKGLKLNDVTKFHNFQFKADSIIVHRAWDVGSGRKLELNKLMAIPQKITPLVLIQRSALSVSCTSGIVDTRSTQNSDNFDPVNDTQDEDAEHIFKSRLFYCDDEGCIRRYHRRGNLLRHIAIGDHVRRVENSCLTDVAMTLYHTKLENVENQQLLSLELERNTLDPKQFAHLSPLVEGWALPTARSAVRLTPKQKQFLINKFNDGLIRGVRWQPEAVVFEMKNSIDEKTGEFKFDVSEFLRVSTVRSFFSRENSRKTPLSMKSSQNIVPEPYVQATASQSQKQSGEQDDASQNEDSDYDNADDEEAYRDQLNMDTEFERNLVIRETQVEMANTSKRPFSAIQNEPPSQQQKSPRFPRKDRPEEH